MTELKQFLDQLTPLSESSWQLLQPLFRERTLARHDHFITEGQPAREIGFLCDGIIRAYYSTESGTEYNKHFFRGPCFTGGYASLISGMPNQINQQALTDCRLWVADYPSFRALYPSCRDLETAARILAEQFFVQKEQREIELALLTAERRYELFRSRFADLEALIPQYHIASYLGVTPTQLSRIRKKLAGK